MHSILHDPQKEMPANSLCTNSSETLSGVTTVRAMAAVPRFVRENEELVEASLRTTYSGQVLTVEDDDGDDDD